MSVISKASLVLIPSGYGEDKLYSEVPNTTAGDFTFTRASTGTRVNADGYIEEVPWNLITYSEDFSNSSYIKDSGVTIGTTNNVSPIGNNTATQIDVTDSGRIYKNVTSAEYRTSVYLKAGTFAYFKFVGQQVDLNLGTISSAYPADIEDVGNGWYRISISYVTSIRPWQIQAYPDDTYTTHTTSGNYFVWGAMLNYGDTTKPYIKTTDRLDIPRLDYSGGASCPTLLLEPQRTNTIVQSEDLSIVTILNNATVTTDQTTSPDNTNTADKVTFGSGSGFFYKQISITAASTFSVFLKFDDYQYFQLMGTGDVDHYANFDIQNGVLGNVGSQATAKIEDYGNGWYRCSLSMYAGTFAGAQRVLKTTSLTTNWNGGGGGAGSVFAWGMQLESGIYETSYIPTSGTSITRVADECYLTSASLIIGQTEGTIYGEFNFKDHSAGTRRLLCLTDGTTTNRITTYINTLDKLSVYIVDGGAAQADIQATILTEGIIKYAVAYTNNNIKLYLNGTQVGTDTSATIPSTTNFYVGSENGNNPSFFDWNQVILFNEALTDTELETLTTI